MAKKKKYYVVWVGLKPGIYSNWDEAKTQISGFPAAKYKSYPTLEEAREAYDQGYVAPPKKSSNKKSTKPNKKLPPEVIIPSISVDAACGGNPGVLEYRGVWTSSHEQLFIQGPFAQGTNNIGEFLAIVHGLAFIQKNEMEDYTIYSDSRIAMGWVKKKKCNTKLKKTKQTAELYALIHRAEEWLRKNQYKSKIVKWETKKWGEIPADFGRK